ncbi:type 11 methyltransferase [Rhodopirellula maiorica SM1]|uniref:Type 11 methyltransferase n=1 Tax=Rhodopirellula maiorica SM1 TaxID=1265738 RepID=M5REU2_9BACT|nr:class I SAM-dependent methyltransferase [Rhodopirellula maiorica]EMI17885.1 type 11 methyltransferase [Rhodopirellula maiorica SM1]
MAAATIHSFKKPTNITTEQVVCVCGSHRLIDLGECRTPGLSRCSEFEHQVSTQVAPGRLYRCLNCHLGLRLPRPNDAVIASLYETLPANRWHKAAVEGSAQHYLIKRLRNRHREPLSILDIGAFDGSFLAAIPNGFSKSAIEPSDAAADLKKNGIMVLKPFLKPAKDVEAGQYDIVTMFDVFEHLADPLEGMRSAMSYVRPGGKLFVGTGDMDHWSWRQTQGTHWYLDPIQHLAVGSRKHFRWQSTQLNASSCRIFAFSHQPGTLGQRCSQALTTIYFGAKRRGGISRGLVRLMNHFRVFRQNAGKDAMPYTQQLHDHLLAEYTRAELGK